jgi:CubicO group peptidase (beta-lactamase class C family)
MQPDSLLPVFSSSKGATAIVIALLVERGLLDLDALVTHYWPEFGQNGKDKVTVRQLLSHQAGLTGVDGGFSFEDLYEHKALAERLAAQRPYWYPGQAYAYHALTIGTLANELIIRIDGRTVQQLLREDICAPRNVDLWMGTPESEDARCVDVEIPPMEEVMAFLASSSLVLETDGLGSLNSPPGGALGLLSAVNSVESRRAGQPAAGMLANGRGLAKLYATTIFDLEGPRLLSDETIAQVAQTQVYGLELGTGLQAKFGIIFQGAFSPRWPFGSYRAFGHDGAGGSIGFADPHHQLSFGYTVKRIPLPGGVDQRALELSKIARQCVTS